MFSKIKRAIDRKRRVFKPSRTSELAGCHAAILVTDGFEEAELFVPKEILEAAGCRTHIVSLRLGKISGWKGHDWGKVLPVDLTISEAGAMTFDFLLLPGGVISTDRLRMDREAIAFAKTFISRKRPIAAICHGIQILIETDLLEGRTLTSWPAIKTDLLNAGANWINREVVVDHKLVTSRRPSDLPDFVKEMLKVFEAGRIHEAIPDVGSFVSVR